VTYLNDLLHRLRLSIGWVAAQFWALLLLALAGLAWTRMPDKYAWQVLLSLLLPLLLVAAVLLLQTGTMRRLLGEEDRRVLLAWGALTLLAWAVVVWIAWAILNWCGDELYAWASYLNSKAPSYLRASVFTYPHLVRWFTQLVWICRWIVVPGKVIPYALDSATSGWRLRVRRDLRVLWNWRWWLAVAAAALAGVLLPSHFFAGLPNGTVHHQVWAVIFKLAGTYLLAVCSWVLLLAWGAVLLARQPQPAEDAFDADLFRRLHASRRWIAALAVWAVFLALASFLSERLSGNTVVQGLAFLSAVIILPPLLVYIQASMLRCMVDSKERRVRLIWGALAMLAWALPGLAAAVLLELPDNPVALQMACWFVVPGIFIPFGTASTQWGFRLPWRRILRILYSWRWWAGVLLMAIAGLALPDLIRPDASSTISAQQEIPVLRTAVADMYSFVSWVLLIAWFAVLLNASAPGASSPGDDSAVPVPVGSAPLGSDSVRLPRPESGGDTRGNA